MKKQFYLIVGAVSLVLSSLVGIMIPLQLKQMIDGSENMLRWGTLGVICALFLGQAVLMAFGQYCIAVYGENQVREQRIALHQHLLALPLRFFHDQTSGELASRLVSDTLSIREFIADSLPMLISGGVTIVGSFVALIYLDWKLTVTLFGALPILAVILAPISNFAEKFSKRMQESISHLTSYLTETFRNVAYIKATATEEEMNQRTQTVVGDAFHVAKKISLVDAIVYPVGLMFLFGAVAVVFGYGGARVAAGTLSIGTLMSFLIFLLQLLNPFGALSSIFANLGRMKGAQAKLKELEALPVEKDTGGKAIHAGDLAFHHVSFAYDEKPILEDLSMELPRGQRIAIVGPSGSGKTTLINLLLRLYPVTDGEICLDGVSIEQFNLRKWRQAIAYVSQSAYFLDGSIYDNLTFGLTHTPTEEEVTAAIREASLEQDLADFPSGLNTSVGEGGGLLSGGQKQRLQIARAYLQKADLFIFDEATANLDADAEFRFTQYLGHHLNEKTVLMIAHRLSTIVAADCIYFLDQGRVTGKGTHQELMASHPDYKRYVEEQMLS